MKYFHFHLNTELFGFHCKELQPESSNKVACLTPGIFEVSVTMFQCLVHKKRYKEKIGKHNKERSGIQCSNN